MLDINSLVDHLPHNDAGSLPKKHKYKLILPDINCAACSLQMINAMTDKESSACNYPSSRGSPVCSSVYHSCADISINGSMTSTSWAHTNPAYSPYDLGEATVRAFLLHLYLSF